MPARVILSFDVEEHDRIEAASGWTCPPERKTEYSERMERTTRRILDLLAEFSTPATFFVVGQIAKSHPKLVRDMVEAGHEVASHSWDHRRVHRFTPETFREDLLTSLDALTQASGQPVRGFRAPTFSIVPETGWAIDVLAEAGLLYDSSIFPVRHDRYGIPQAPRTPFLAQGASREILEIPPATWRVCGQNLPVAGGGYFRLFPPMLMRCGVAQLGRTTPGVSMLYFHPWEFDADQPRLPLGRFAAWRTYVGIGRTMARLRAILARYHGQFCRAVDLVQELDATRSTLPKFRISTDQFASP